MELAAFRRWLEAYGRASFLIDPPGLKTKLDGIFVIALDVAQFCTSLREWWHKQQ